jgi:Zn-dependent membrane protease YugP
VASGQSPVARQQTVAGQLVSNAFVAEHRVGLSIQPVGVRTQLLSLRSALALWAAFASVFSDCTMNAGSLAEAVNFCPANWKSLSLRSKILPRVRPCEVFQLTRSPTDKSVMVDTLRRGARVM